MIIRLAKKTDCLELAKLKKKVWETTYRGIYPDEKIDNFDLTENSEKFKAIIKNPNIKLFVVEDGGSVVGYMDCGNLFKPYKNYKQEIGLLYILEEYQGKGLGRKLFEKGFNEIKNNGYNEFIVSCNKYNIQAQEFYKRMGGIIIDIDNDEDDKSKPQVKFLYKIKAVIP